MKKVIKELIPYVIIIIVVTLTRTYIATPVIVVGDSMLPTLKEGNILLLNKFDYKFNEIERYDIVVIKTEKEELIKRIIGLPGEHIEYKDSTLYINNKKYENKYNFITDDFTLEEICDCDKIPENKYLVLGDNRGNSLDSRSKFLGLVDKKYIKGSTKISIWPMKKIK